MFFFEHSILVAVLGIVASVSLLARWGYTNDPAHGRFFGAATIVTLVLVIANWAIVTPRERIIEICRELARLVDDGNVTELGRQLAPDFTASGFNREEFLDRVAVVLTRARLDQVRLRNLNVEWEADDRAVATFDATCNVRMDEGFAAALPSRWRLRFSQYGQHWRLRELESIPIPPLNWKTIPFRP